MFHTLIAGALLLAHLEDKPVCSASDTILLEYTHDDKKPTTESIQRIQLDAAKIFRSCTISIIILDAQSQQDLSQITQDRIYEIENMLLLEGIDESIIETKREKRSKIKIGKNEIALVIQFQPIYSRALHSNVNPECQRDTSIEQPFSLKMSMRYCDLKQAVTLPNISASNISQLASNRLIKEISVLNQFKFENPDRLSIKLIYQNPIKEKKLNYFLEKFQVDCNCWSGISNVQFATVKTGKTILYHVNIIDSGDYRIISEQELIKKSYGLLCPSTIGIKKAHIESADGIIIPVDIMLGGKAILTELTQEKERYTLVADFIALDGKKYFKQKILLTDCYKQTEKSPLNRENQSINSIKMADIPSEFGLIPLSQINNYNSVSYEK